MLGQNDRQGARSQARVQGNEPGVAPHDLHKKEAVVGIGGVANLVDAFHHGVARGVVPNGEVRTEEVVVYGARNAHYGDAVLFPQEVCAGEGPVSANDHEAVDALGAHLSRCLSPPFGRAKPIRPRRFQHGAAHVQDVLNAFCVQFRGFARNQAVVPAVHTQYALTVKNTGPHHGTDGGVHAGSVAP